MLNRHGYLDDVGCEHIMAAFYIIVSVVVSRFR